MLGYIIVLVIGAVVVVKFGRDIFLGQESRSWPNTPGTILYTGMEKYQNTDEDGSTTTSYGVSVKYSYNLAGQAFEGTRRTFSDVRSSSRRRAEQILARYPQGGEVRVYYDPDNPASCVLETGVGRGAYVLIVFAIGLFLFGLAGLFGFIG